MNDLKSMIRTIGLFFHAVAATGLLLLFLKTRGMTVFCVVAGGLIGCASVAAWKADHSLHRIWPTYGLFILDGCFVYQ